MDIRQDTETESEESNMTEESEYTSDETNDSNTTEESSDYQESPWRGIVNGTFKELQSEYKQKVENYIEAGHSENDAHSLGYKDMFKEYRDVMGEAYLNLVFWMQNMRRDPVHRKIKDTVQRLREDEDYDTREAWKYAVDKRRYLFDRVLETYIPPSTEDSNDSV